MFYQLNLFVIKFLSNTKSFSDCSQWSFSDTNKILVSLIILPSGRPFGLLFSCIAVATVVFENSLFDCAFYF